MYKIFMLIIQTLIIYQNKLCFLQLINWFYFQQICKGYLYNKEMNSQVKRENTIEASETQFLTFRHNQPQLFDSTGRSVASQKIEYKSLQKYPIDLTPFKKKQPQQQFLNEYNNAQLIQFQHSNTYKKKVKAVRSQERIVVYQRIEPDFPHFQSIDCESPFPYLEQSSIEMTVESKNEILRKKMDRLIRNLKKQQRKQLSLQKQIASQKQQIDKNQKYFMEQEESITQLQQIFVQNSLQCEKISKNIRSSRNKNQLLREQLASIDQSQYDSFQITRSQHYNNLNLIKTLNAEISRIKTLKQQITNKEEKLQKSIRSMQQWIQRSHQVDNFIRDIVNRQGSKNSTKQRIFPQFSSINSLDSDK